MKKLFPISFLVILVYFFSAAANAQQARPVNAAAAALLAADQDFAKVSEAKSAAEAFAMYLAEDAMQLPGGANPIFGRQAIVDAMGSGYTLKWEPKKADVAKSGELGWTWGTYELHAKDNEGKPVVRYGKYVNVWRKQSDGKWKVIVDLGNPSPPPEGK